MEEQGNNKSPPKGQPSRESVVSTVELPGPSERSESSGSFDDPDGLCEVTGMTGKQKQLVQQSWRKLVISSKQSINTSGVKLLLWMFENIHGMRARFTSLAQASSGYNFVTDAAFMAHTRAVLLALDSLVNLIFQPQELEEKMRLLSLSHLGQRPMVSDKEFSVGIPEKVHKILEVGSRRATGP